MIPAEWNPYKFEQIATIRKKRIDPKISGRYSFCVELEHIGQGSGQLIGYSTTTAESSLKAQFHVGDVLFGRLRAYLEKYWLADRDGVCSTEIWPLVPNSDLVTSQYLFQLIQTSQFIKAASMAYGTHMPRTDWDVIKNHEVLLPSLNEQQSIATALSDVDTLITSLDKLIAKKRDIKQTTMQQLLTGKTRLPEFRDAWVVKTLGEIGEEFVNGGTPSTQKSEYWQGKIPWITGADIIDQRVSEIRRFITAEAIKNSATNIIEKCNLLLVTRTGVGKLAIAPFDVAISQDITGIYVKKELALIEYLFHYFNYNAEILRNLNQGTSIAGITRETLLSTKIYLPSLSEQQAIATVLSDMDAEIVALEQKRDKVRALKQGMMQELLTAKTRLV